MDRYLLSAAALVSSGVLALGGEVPLDYAVFAPFRSTRDCGYPGSQTLVARAKPPVTLRTEPKYVLERPLYVTAKLGGEQTFAMVLDSTLGVEDELDRLYVDRDGDGDLEEETPVPGIRRSGRAVFGPAYVLIDRGGTRSIYHFSLSRYGGNRFTLSAACAATGEVVIGGRICGVVITDGNGNGLFNDAAELPRAGDRLMVDLDGDGAFSKDLERQDLGRANLIDGVFYTFDVAPDGSRVTVREPDMEFGWIKLTHPAEYIWICSEAGLFKFAAPDGLDMLRVPVSSYRLSGLRISRQDGEDKWVLSAGTDEKEMVPCVVRAGKVAVMPVGPPIRLVADVTPGGSSTVSINVRLLGQAGEGYSTCQKNGSKLPPPSVGVVDAAGEEVYSAAMEYG